MTKFTRAKPFEFEGKPLWRNGDGWVGGHLLSLIDPRDARAIHAFIEAERNTWHWTNDDHTEARNGRWVAFRFELTDQWRLAHDDFDVPRPMCLAYEGDTDDGMSHADAAANRKMIDFLAWRAEQDQPEEPTGLGAVARTAHSSWPDSIEYTHTGSGRWWMNWPAEHKSWDDVIRNAETVTLLSEGVTP